MMSRTYFGQPELIKTVTGLGPNYKFVLRAENLVHTVTRQCKQTTYLMLANDSSHTRTVISNVTFNVNVAQNQPKFSNFL